MLTSNERGREQEAGAAGHSGGVRRTYAAAGDSSRVRSTPLGEGGGRGREAGGAGGDGAITPRVLQVVNASVKARERERERERASPRSRFCSVSPEGPLASSAPTKLQHKSTKPNNEKSSRTGKARESRSTGSTLSGTLI